MANRGRRWGALLTLATVASWAPLVAPANAEVTPTTPADQELGQPEPDASTADTVTASSTARTSATATTKPRTTTVSASATGLFGLTPSRLVDTRGSAMLARGVPLTVPIIGAGGVPSSAVAAAINITVTDPQADGFVTAAPCGAAYGTSTINFSRKQTIANLAVVGLGTGGAVCITSSIETNVIVDLSGYVAKGGQLYTPINPNRILDTRSGLAVEAATPTVVHVAGTAGVPATGVDAASVNFTITDPVADGWAVAYPCGGSVPEASNVNFTRKGSAGNGVVVDLDANGDVCLYSSVKTHMLLDLTGWFGTSGTEVQPSAPTRLLDTRLGDGRAEADEVVRIVAAPGALGSVINITVAEPSAAGYVTAWPCETSKPETSVLNYKAGQTIANAALAPVSTSGYVCLAASTKTHLIVDRMAVLGLAGSGKLDSTGSVVTDWALTQVGDVYAAMNPYRFGDSKYGKAWDCAAGETSCSKVDTQNKTRTSAAGSYVYDCSGLVVAAWLRAGVDLVKLGASWTEPMLTKLPQVTRETAQVGDLIMFDFDPTDADPVDHVGLYISPTEMVHAGTCPGGTSAVCRTTINWKNAVAVLRPPTA